MNTLAPCLGGIDALPAHVEPIDLADDARVDRREGIVEGHRRFTRSDVVNELTGSDADAIDSDERLAALCAGGRDRLDPLETHGGECILLDRRDQASDDAGNEHRSKIDGAEPAAQTGRWLLLRMSQMQPMPLGGTDGDETSV